MNPQPPTIEIAERAQAMLLKDERSAVIVGLGFFVIVLGIAVWKLFAGRVRDLKETNNALLKFIGESTQATLIQNRMLDERLPKKGRGTAAAPSAVPALPPPKEGAG